MQPRVQEEGTRLLRRAEEILAEMRSVTECLRSALSVAAQPSGIEEAQTVAEGHLKTAKELHKRWGELVQTASWLVGMWDEEEEEEEAEEEGDEEEEGEGAEEGEAEGAGREAGAPAEGEGEGEAEAAPEAQASLKCETTKAVLDLYKTGTDWERFTWRPEVRQGPSLLPLPPPTTTASSTTITPSACHSRPRSLTPRSPAPARRRTAHAGAGNREERGGRVSARWRRRLPRARQEGAGRLEDPPLAHARDGRQPDRHRRQAAVADGGLARHAGRLFAGEHRPLPRHADERRGLRPLHAKGPQDPRRVQRQGAAPHAAHVSPQPPS